MNVEEVMKELESLSNERMKKMYVSNGAREPLFGVATGAMKPLSKLIKKNQSLAEELYSTGNYDAMYFAGVIAEPNQMTEADYNRWLDGAYFYMLSDYVVAVTLAEAEIGEELALKWIQSEEELKQSAGWSCYCWMLGNRKDETFQPERINELLQLAEKTIHESPNRAKVAMSYFVSTVGVSYKPCHEEAIRVAEAIGEVMIESRGKPKMINSIDEITKAMEKNRIGFKRRYVRC